ncbi:MAG: glycoside hydrolase family 127 protein [Armatimonadetes bacterium]|nr:glycoside hydrolase family 127 protein [Armatimonadota bacterium]
MCASALVLLAAGSLLAPGADSLQPLAHPRLRFDGVVAPRIAANVDHWLLTAPDANPGMLAMFALRDRQPEPQLVPWAGEFAGKYLLSCVAALGMTDRPDLAEHTRRFVAQLIASQADDGYLGPFPKARRLLGDWDLWGHYHVMQGLLAWYDHSGDEAAMAAVRRAADLVCRTYLDANKRVLDAGSPEMNMAISHVLAELHRRTGEPRYLTQTLEILRDWEKAGDYLRCGEAGVPFYRTPRPRWESLHDLQALAELWRVSGEERYRRAFESHWRTIRDFDRRNSGAFSGGEQATGNAFTPSAIETCCTVAWMALSVDMLRLTADPTVADELELSTYNAALAAQHPSGRWCTYNTPMDGARLASAHDIVFQARAGTPELNCCSVNGPRSLGMLSQWSVMRADQGLTVNWLGPMTATLPGGTLTVTGDYPRAGQIMVRLQARTPTALRVRMPAWAEGATARLNGKSVAARPGTYLAVPAAAETTVALDLPLPLRCLDGQREQFGKVSVYRGPLLLAWDQLDTAFDEQQTPRLDTARLAAAKVVGTPTGDALAPWLWVDVPAGDQPLRLRDYASAGSRGERYRSWLRVPGHDVALGPDALIVAAPLRADAKPTCGVLVNGQFAALPAGDGLRLNGRDQMLTYALPEPFGPDFTVALRVLVRELPAEGHLGQLISAWCAGGDDPIRVTLDRGKLYARIEGGGFHGTSGAELGLGAWHRVAAVKTGAKLRLYVDGAAVGEADVPAAVTTGSRLLAVGGNPLYTGQPEFAAIDVADLLVRGRALSAEEVAALGR